MSKHIVTGAFSFTGRFIAEELLRRGFSVATLSRRPDDSLLVGQRLEVHPLNFDQPAELARSLEGAEVLHNTYWVRFNHGSDGFERAIRNTEMLFQAAKRAGIRKLVHLSVSNPSLQSPLHYFRGKAIVEECVKDSGLAYTIFRPTLIFGSGDLLLNNIAYFLRHYPLFLIPGDGAYRVQPVAAEDVARLASDAAQDPVSRIITAAGPDSYRFDEIVRMIARALGRRTAVIHSPVKISDAACRALGVVLRDVVVTRQEIQGLMDNLLVSRDPPTGSARFVDWLQSAGGNLGQEYRSELRRNFT
jgi:NADH dehydrogenase